MQQQNSGVTEPIPRQQPNKHVTANNATIERPFSMQSVRLLLGNRSVNTPSQQYRGCDFCAVRAEELSWRPELRELREQSSKRTKTRCTEEYKRSAVKTYCMN
jgi:hypothetical protein